MAEFVKGRSMISYSIQQDGSAARRLLRLDSKSLLCSEGTELWPQGESSSRVLALKRGIVKEWRAEENGEAITLSLRFSGAILGTTECLLRVPHASTAETVTECLLEQFDSRAFRHKVLEDRDFSWQIHQIQGEESMKNVSLLSSLGCRTARYRLSDLLRQTFRHWEWPQAVVARVPLSIRMPYSQKEAAQVIGVTPEHLNRMLKKFNSSHFFQWKRSSLVVENLQEFRKWVFTRSFDAC